MLRDVDVDDAECEQRRVVLLLATRHRRVQRVALHDLERDHGPETNTRTLIVSCI